MHDVWASDDEMIARAMNIPGLKIVFGTDAVAGAFGNEDEEFIFRVEKAKMPPMAGARVRQFGCRRIDESPERDWHRSSRACKPTSSPLQATL